MLESTTLMLWPVGSCPPRDRIFLDRELRKAGPEERKALEQHAAQLQLELRRSQEQHEEARCLGLRIVTQEA